jgi:hypothetical protein
MAKNIALPDGRTLTLTGNETPEQLSALKEKLRTKYKTVQPQRQEQGFISEQPTASQYARTVFEQGMQGLTAGFEEEITDPLSVVASSLMQGKLGDIVSGDISDTALAQEAANIKRTTKARQAEQQKELPITATGSNVAGNIATALIFGPQKAAQTFAGRLGQQAVAGAVLEGASGVGTAEGDLYDRLKIGAKRAATGAVLSAGTGAALEGAGKLAKGAYGMTIAPRSSQAAITEAIQQGAPVSAGQVMGGATAASEGYLSQMASGQGLRELGEQQGRYLEGQAAGLFNVKIPTTMEEAGQSIVTGLKKSSERYIQRKNRMYDAALKNIPNSTVFIPQKSRQIVNDIIAQGGDNKALSKLISAPEFKVIDDALSGNVTLGQAKKSLKSAVWDIVKSYEEKQPNLSRQFKDIYFAIDDDILGSVNAVDPLAAGKLKAADAYMADRMKMNERLAKIFNPSKGANETAAKAYYKAVGMATDGRSADKETLMLLKKALPKDEFDEFRSFFFSNLGRETAGQSGTVSNIIPRKFLTDVNKITPEAKNILLDGPQRTALQKMAEYADIVSPVTLNKSGSAGGIADLTSAGAAAAFSNPWFLALPVGNYIYGKSYNTPAGKMLVKAINKLPREIMTSPPNQAVRNALRGQLLNMGASQSIIDEIEAQFEQPTGE